MIKINLIILFIILIIINNKYLFAFETLEVQNDPLGTFEFNFMAREAGEETNYPQYPNAERDLTVGAKTVTVQLDNYWPGKLNSNNINNFIDSNKFLINIFGIYSNEMNAGGVSLEVLNPNISYPATRHVSFNALGMDTSGFPSANAHGPFSGGGRRPDDELNCFPCHGPTIIAVPMAYHEFEFIITQDGISGYGAEVTAGYLGRHAGRGLTGMGPAGGAAALPHGSAVKADDFLTFPEAVSLTANLERNPYPAVTAEAFDCRKFSHAGLNGTFPPGSGNPPAGPERFASRPEQAGGSSLPVNEGAAFAKAGAISDSFGRIDGAAGSAPPRLAADEADYPRLPRAPRVIQAPLIQQASRVLRPYGERHAPSGGEGGDRPWSLRASPWYSHIRHEAREGLIGYTVKALGLTLGVERSLFGGSALAGMTLSAAMPEVNGDGISLDTHIVSASSYATAILPFEIDLSAIVSYSLSRYDQDRVSEGSHYFAGYHGRGVSAAAMAGRRFQFARQFAARPYARMDYIHNDMEAYAEMGQGAQARTMSRNSTDLWQSELGADLIFSAENGLRLTGRLGWTRHFNNTTEFEGNYLPNQPSPSLFRVLSVQFDRTAFVYGLDVKFPVAESVDIGVSYDGSFSDHDSSHTGALTGNFSF
jgi:hypothetical protein